jgi:hypothetical protein
MRVLPLFLIVAAVLPASASAALVPQKSLSGIGLGMSEDEVRAARGEPDEVNHPQHPIAGESTEFRYGLTYVTILPQSGVVSITTTSRRETYRGVGVGSTEKALRAKVSGERCQTEFGYRDCHLGRFEPGKTVTVWHISRKTRRVRRITLGYVID